MTDASPERDLFTQLVERARTIIMDDGAPPMLDDDRLFSDVLELTTDHMFDNGKAIERALPKHDWIDPAARSVTASMLWYLSRGGDLSPIMEEELLPSRKDLFRRYVSFSPPDSISDLGQLRWEVHAAAAVGDLQRVIALGHRAEQLDPELTDLLHVARVVFLLIHPNHPRDWEPSSWEPNLSPPDIRDARQGFLDLCTMILSIYVERPSAEPNRSTWIEPTNLDKATLDGIRLCHSWLEVVERRTGVLADAPSFARCWCEFALGSVDSDPVRLTKAASHYVSLSKRAPFEGERQSIKTFAILAAIRCLVRAEQFPEAERLVRELTKTFDDASLQKMLTLCLMKQGRMTEATEAFVEWTRLSEESEDKWLAPLVMHLGFQVMSHQSIATAIENAALFASARPLGEGLMRWHSPWTASMSPEAQRKWWVGLYTLASDEARQNMGDSVWEQAIVCFAEAVAIEWKVRIFRLTTDTSTTPDAKGQSDVWGKAIAGRATLGEMVECLLQARQPAHAAAKSLRRRLDERHTEFSRYLTTRGKELTRLNELRNRAAHTELGSSNPPPSPLTQKDTETVFRIATDVLQILNA